MTGDINTDQYHNRELARYLKDTEEPRISENKGDVFKEGKWYNRAWDGEKIIYKPVKK